jgi:hypothetical protein
MLSCRLRVLQNQAAPGQLFKKTLPSARHADGKTQGLERFLFKPVHDGISFPQPGLKHGTGGRSCRLRSLAGGRLPPLQKNSMASALKKAHRVEKNVGAADAVCKTNCHAQHRLQDWVRISARFFE